MQHGPLESPIHLALLPRMADLADADSLWCSFHLCPAQELRREGEMVVDEEGVET